MSRAHDNKKNDNNLIIITILKVITSVMTVITIIASSKDETLIRSRFN